jgi:hypothetical protein
VKYLIPGGSSGHYRRDGFTFDVGSSVMFGFSDKVGGLALILMLAVLGLRPVSPQLSGLIAVCREECVDWFGSTCSWMAGYSRTGRIGEGGTGIAASGIVWFFGWVL